MTFVTIKRADPPSTPKPGMVTDRLGNMTLYLSPDDQRKLWRGLQQHKPEVADLFMHDPFIAQARELFDANPMLSVEEIQQFMET